MSDRTDDFTGTSGDPLSANWTTQIGAFVINANHAMNTGGGGSVFWGADAFDPDQHSQFVVVDALSLFGATVRAAGTGGAANAYIWFPQFGFYRLDSGSLTNIDSTTATVVAGDTIKITVAGTTLEAFLNGVSKGTKVDATYSTGAPGFHLSASNNTRADDWLGGPLAGAGVTAAQEIGIFAQQLSGAMVGLVYKCAVTVLQWSWSMAFAARTSPWREWLVLD